MGGRCGACQCVYEAEEVVEQAVTVVFRGSGKDRECVSV